jgi:hypothetical protein
MILNWGIRSVVVAAVLIAFTAAPSAALATEKQAPSHGVPRADKVVVASSAKATVEVLAGKLSPSGLALIGGKLPKSHPSAPKAYVLSHNASFGSGDVTLSSAPEKAKKGTYRAWVSLADNAATGRWRLLACSKATPSHAGCFAIGMVRVTTAAAPEVATPTLETGRSVSHVFQGKASSVTATGKDGTTFTMSVPASDFIYPVQLTPVASLSPAGVVGNFIDGVMITPIGDAPPGATLTIKPAKKVSAKAQLVGFGGIDPAGAAFPLPIVFGKTAKFPVMSLGGYGIAVPAASKANVAHACAALPVPAASISLPIVSCSSAAKRVEEMSKALIQDIAEARQTALMGEEPSPKLGEDIDHAVEAETAAIDQEASAVFNQPPSDEGAAELQVLATLALGVGRDIELAGLPNDGRANEFIVKVMGYYLDNLRRSCDGGGPQPAAVLLANAMNAFSASRQLLLMGLDDSSDEAFSLRAACLLRVKVQLTVDDTSGVADSELDVNASVSAPDVVIAGKKDDQVYGGVVLQAPDTNLTYNSSGVTVEPLWVEAGETATVTGTTGFVHVNNANYSATSNVQCASNGKFVVDRDVQIWIKSEDLWQDVQRITTYIEGTLIGTRTGSVVASAWSQDLGTAKLPALIGVQLDGTHGKTQTELKDSSPCRSSVGCTNYSYDATFKAISLTG